MDGEVIGRLARELGVEPARLGRLEPELLEAVARRLQALSDDAAVDELTGTLRRATGLAALQREVHRAQRYREGRLVVVFVDGVGLKALNEERGHAAGDTHIRELAGALRRRLRASDLLIRWGGDEFVCVLPQAGREGAERVLADVTADLVARSGPEFRAGIAELEIGEGSEEEDAEALVARADADLRRAKRSPRDRKAGRGLERLGESTQKRQGKSVHSLA